MNKDANKIILTLPTSVTRAGRISLKLRCFRYSTNCAFDICICTYI